MVLSFYVILFLSGVRQGLLIWVDLVVVHPFENVQLRVLLRGGQKF